MYEKNFFASIISLIKDILNRIGNPSSPQEGSLSYLMELATKSRVLRYILYSYINDLMPYETTSSTYEVVKTFTIQVPFNVISYTYIMFFLKYHILTNSLGSIKWEIGFGSNPSTWTIIEEYDKNQQNGQSFENVYVLDPSIYEANNTIKLRLSLKKNSGDLFIVRLMGTGYCDVQYY